MEQIRTIRLKLDISTKDIQPTIDAYTKAYNFVCQAGWNDKDFNGVSLHHKTYQTTRQYLPADLAISARVKATESLKSVRQRLKKNKKATCPKSKQCSIRYNSKTFNVWFDKNLLSLLTTNGRIKIGISVPEYFKQYITWKRKSAELIIRNNKVFLNIVFQTTTPDIQPSGEHVGIDRGIKKIAVVSDNRFFGGGRIKQTSQKYEKIRSKLQSVGTRSSKRHLAKLKGKENRFRTNENHCITKQIVEEIEPGTTIVLEKLTGIRGGSVKFRKQQRKEANKWSFFQFEEFLKYKATSKGISVVYVDARYTSQRCSKCGYISRSNRRHQSVFKCKQCNFQLNADLNGSRNIWLKHLDATGYPGRAVVNQPIAPLLG